MPELKKLELTSSDVRKILTVLGALKENLLVSIDAEWEEDEYGEPLVDIKSLERVIRKLEASLPTQDVNDVKRSLLTRKYHPYHHELDERAYSILRRAFRSRKRIEMDYFSLEREEITKERLRFIT